MFTRNFTKLLHFYAYIFEKHLTKRTFGAPWIIKNILQFFEIEFQKTQKVTELHPETKYKRDCPHRPIHSYL